MVPSSNTIKKTFRITEVLKKNLLQSTFMSFLLPLKFFYLIYVCGKV